MTKFDLNVTQMALLGSPFSNPKPRQILHYQHLLFQIKPLNSFQVPQFRNTHLSNHLRNSSFRCHSLKQTQKSFKQQEKAEKEVGSEVQEYEFERLFSNLNQATLKHEPGSLSSSIFLVAGTTDLQTKTIIGHGTERDGLYYMDEMFQPGNAALARESVELQLWMWHRRLGHPSLGLALVIPLFMIGAGILAIPAVTQESGFLASAVACIGCWVYMVVTGLLIAEVNVNTMCELGSGGVSLVSMAKRTVGSLGVQLACWSYIFIHYALLVAYVARSSDILTNYLGIPQWESAALFSLTFGALCYFGSQRFIGAVNGLLVLGIIISFTALVAIASTDLHLDALLKANFEAVPSSIPVIALAYVYHNVVPVLCTNLEGDLSKVRTAVVIGTAIPLLLFLVWNGVILGTFTNLDSDVGKILDPLQQLRSSNGVVGPIVDIFSFFAIGTSYLGFVLGLADFLADLLKLPAGQSKPLPYLITLFPPLVLALLDPEIFFKALDFAGTYGVLVLFGVLPAAMSWSDRYVTSPELPKVPQLVPGGKFTLSIVMGGAVWVILSEILDTFNHS